MPRPVASLRIREITDAAAELLEALGIEAFTLRALAARVSMRAPSLYRHFADKDAILLAIVADGFDALADALEQADSLEALAAAYRAFARARPERYRLMFDRPIAAADRPRAHELRAFAPIIARCGGSVLEARVAAAFAHGMVSLELSGRLADGPDLDAAWRDGLARIERSGKKSR